jgi:hypothetical protein
LPEFGKKITSSIQKINNYSLLATQTHFRNIGNGTRPIYIIRERKIECSRHYREPDRYSDVNLKYLRIYKR